MINCPKCNEENPPKFRLCGYCGAPLVAAPPPLPVREVRRTVTLIFCDLKGSTALGERLDPEALHEVKERYFAAMAAEITRHGGKIEKYIGDAIMAVFGLPLPHEDDALRAVRAAAGMQPRCSASTSTCRRATASRWQPDRRQHRRSGRQRRPGGRPEARHRRRRQRRGAARAGRAGERDLPRREHLPAGARRGRGRGGRAARAQGQERAGGGVPARSRPRDSTATSPRRQPDRRPRRGARGDRPDACARCARHGTVRLVTIVGDAGIGKSRLAHEVMSRAGSRGARVVRGAACPTATASPSGRCATCDGAADIRADDTPGAGARQAAALIGDADVAARLASAIGLSDGASRCTRSTGRRASSSRSWPRDGPVVALVDDIHWAEPAFLDLLEHVLDSAEARRSCCWRRRATTCSRSGPSGVSGPRSRAIVLQPLSDAAAARVADNLLGAPACRPTCRRASSPPPKAIRCTSSRCCRCWSTAGACAAEDGRWVRGPSYGEIDDPADDQGAARGAARPARPRGALRRRAGGGDRPGVPGAGGRVAGARARPRRASATIWRR